MKAFWNSFFHLFIGGFLILFCLFYSKSNFQKLPPTAIRGVLDLKNWNFEKDGIISLVGEWEFYPEKLLTEKDFQKNQNSIQASYVKVPMKWNSQLVDGKKISNIGYATFRIRIINCNDPGLLYKLIRQESSYKVISNGTLFIESGTVGKDESTSQPGYKYQINSFPENNKDVSLIVQIANFHNYKGGFTHPFLLGKEKDILRKHDNALFIDFFISGSLFIMGFYHLGTYMLWRKEKSTVYFGIFCILLSIRSIVTGEFFLHNFLSVKYFDPLLRLDLLTVYLSNPIFILYVSHVFPDETNSLFKKIILFGSYLLTSIVIFFPPIFSRSTLTIMHFIITISCLFTIQIVILAIKNKREGARSFFLGSIIFILFVINDILNTQYIIRTGLFAPLGFFIFIFSQAYILSYRSANAYIRVEELSKDLLDKSNELENKNIDLSVLSSQLSSANTKLIHILECAKKISSLRNKQSIYIEGYHTILSELKWLFKPSLIIYCKESEEDSNLYKKIHFTANKINDEIVIDPKLDPSLTTEEFSRQLDAYKEVFISSGNLIVPIIYNENHFCIFEISGIDHSRFTGEDKNYVQTIAETLAITLANLDYFNEQKEKIRMELELHTASIVQNALFPSSPPSIPGLDIYGFCKTASEIGGDWFGFSTKMEDYLYIFIGDVTGHGSAAGLITSGIYSIVKQMEKNCLAENKHYTPIEWNELLNHAVYDMGIDNYYMTFLTLRIALNSGEMLYSNAAHCSPMVVRNDKIELLKESSSLFFGLEKNLIFDQGKFQLKKDDVILLYTDGVYESRNEQNEMFGVDRTQKILLGLDKLNSKQIAENLYKNIIQHCNGIPHQDDVTILVIRVLKDF